MLAVKLHKPKAVKVYNPVVLIMGDGRSLPEDIKTFLDWGIPHDAYSIGRSYQAYKGEITHWGDIDGLASKWWTENLPDRENIQTHTVGDAPGFDLDWNIHVPWDDGVRWRGSTSLFAALSCLEMGYDKIILAGCPLDSEGHWYFDPEHKGPDWAPEDFNAWAAFAKLPQADKLRSLSGYTAEVLGKAEKGWIINDGDFTDTGFTGRNRNRAAD